MSFEASRFSALPPDGINTSFLLQLAGFMVDLYIVVPSKTGTNTLQSVIIYLFNGSVAS